MSHKMSSSFRTGAPWVDAAGLDSSAYGTQSMRRTKATLIYKRTKYLRAVQLLLDHTKLESTVRYLGIEVDDACSSALVAAGADLRSTLILQCAISFSRFAVTKSLSIKGTETIQIVPSRY